MQLDQPIPPTPSGGQNQYDFILNGPQKSRTPRVFKSGGSRKQRTMTIVGLGLGGCILLFIIFKLFSGSANTTQSMLLVAQTQNEIARVSLLGSIQAKDTSTRDFSETVYTTVTSQQNATVAYLKKNGKKTSAKVLGQGKNLQTDPALKSAREANTFDTVVAGIISKSLLNYQTQLATAYKSAKGKNQQKLLQQLYSQLQTLLKNHPPVTSS